MSLSAKSPVNFRVLQSGVELAVFSNVMLVIRSNMVGTVVDVPCFSELRFVDFWDRRRAMDITTKSFRGPLTIEIVSASTGERISTIAVADREDVASHPRGKVAYA